MNVNNDKWITRLLSLADEISTWSKDESTKVGAVITTEDGKPISWGFNGMPMGVDDSVPERHERPLKYRWFAHAERNAMDLSSRSDLSGCVMFVTMSPCPNCAQSIIQRQLKTVVVKDSGWVDNLPDRWREEMTIAMEMLLEAGVNVVRGP